jgi:drug/metabolite transporter (DMT)-like permease
MIPFPGELAALSTAVLWTASSLSFAAATVRIGSVYVNVTRLIAAAVILSAIVFTFGLQSEISSSQATYLFFSGLVGLVFGDTFLFKSYEYNSARISSLVMSSSPALTALFAFLMLGETLSFLALVGMAVTLVGIVIVILDRRDVSSSSMRPAAIGLFYAFLGAVGQAGGLILAKEAFMQGPINGFVATLIRIVASVLVIVPLNWATGRFREPRAVFARDRRAFGLTMLGTAVGPVFGVTLSLIAISYTNAAVAATLMATVPIMMLPTVSLIHSERLSWRAVAGAFIAVGGVALLFLR